MENKIRSLRELAERRVKEYRQETCYVLLDEKASEPREYNPRNDAANGFYFVNIPTEFDGKEPWVSPRTRLASDVDSDYVILLQDWAPTNLLDLKDPLKKDKIRKLGYDPDCKTNRHLHEYVKIINIRVDKIKIEQYDAERVHTFITNAFPFLKSGDAQAYIPTRVFHWAYREFCDMQIAFLKPRFVICCGSRVYYETWTRFKQQSGLKTHNSTKSFVDERNIRYFRMPHPTKAGREDDWKELKEEITDIDRTARRV